jgi:Flp pilus assembly protein TadD
VHACMRRSGGTGRRERRKRPRTEFSLSFRTLTSTGAVRKRSFRRAMELAPNDAEVKLYLGTQLAAFAEVEPAIELTRQSLAIEPLRAGWYSWLATYLSGVNRLDEAELAIRRAIGLQPGAGGY